METGDFAQVAIAALEGNTQGIIDIFIENSLRFRLAIIIFLLRIATLIRVIKDSNARSGSFRFQLLSIFLIIAFTPIFGLLLYIAIRPQGWKRDKTPRRDTHFQNIQFCVNCGESIQTNCRECQKKYSKSYKYCPYCGAPNLEE